MAIILPTRLFLQAAVPQLALGGQGGKEKEIIQSLRGAVRVKHPLYDFEVPHKGNTLHVEVKKSNDTQWFDTRKYHALTAEQERIVMVFYLHKDGVVDTVAAITLGALLHMASKDTDMRKAGWTAATIKQGHALMQKHPSMQWKAKLHMRKMITQYESKFQMLYLA